MKAAASFNSGFILPLVTGGELRVGPPLDSEDLAALEAMVFVAADEVQQIEAARRALAAELCLYPLETPLDTSALRLCIGIHNLLFLSHPDADRDLFSRSSWARMEAFTSRLLELPPPRTAEETLARHTLTHNLISLSRSDVDLECWVASYSFKGMTPPKRLRRWPRLRRVKERHAEIIWPGEDPLTDLQRAWLAQILRASPLTDLLHPVRSLEGPSWIDAAWALRWPEISRLVASRYLELGVQEVGPPLVKSFWALVKTAPSSRWRQAVRLVAGLMFHLFTADLFFGEHEATDPEQDPLAPLLLTLSACRECGLAPPGSTLPSALVDRLNNQLRHFRPPHDTALLRAGLEGAVP